MSSKKPHAGQKRPASAAPTPKRAAPAASAPASAKQPQRGPQAKKQKQGPAPAAAAAAARRPSFGLPVGESDDSDDDAAIQRLKAGMQRTPAATSSAMEQDDGDEDDGFEVAPASDGDDEGDAAEPRALRPPSSDEDDEDEPPRRTMEPVAAAAAAPTPRKSAATAAPASAAKPAAAASDKLKCSDRVNEWSKPTATSASAAAATPSKPSPALKATPAPVAKASPALKPQQPSAKKAPAAAAVKREASDDDEETSDEEEAEEKSRPAPAAPKQPAAPAAKPKAPAAKTAPAAPATAASPAQRPTPAPTAAPAAAVPRPATKPTFKVVAGDSSESSDDEEPELAVPVYKKPQPARKPTPLQGDASVNPPPKAPRPAAAAASTAAAGSAAAASSSFVHPLTRPAPAEHTGRAFTVTIALPGSIISNAQSRELRTYVAGQIARAAATFCVDEIVVFAEAGKQSTAGSTAGHFEGATRSTDPDVFLARILQYLETPQYLRKQLFPKHADLAAAGLLNPLDSPHHVRADEETPYREGVVVNRPVTARPGQDGETAGCWVNIGLKNEAFIPRAIEPGTRVTVHVPQVAGSTTRTKVAGRAVSHATPREKNGTYWGYQTRLAQSLGQVWSECPFKGGYDLSIGTSERGDDCHAPGFTLPPFRHLILFFGGLAGLEEHIEADESLVGKRPEELFNSYVNCVVGQGCRTIRTEEAVPITLSALYRHVRVNQPPEA